MGQIEITEKERQEIRKLQLEMLVETDRICSKYGLKYCLGYGSLLGAVRHGGFIPWDDDADILMLREDYEKFKAVSKRELAKHIFLQDDETDEAYLWGYSKLRNLNTTYVRHGQEHIKCKNGVFVDIFPLDEVPDFLPMQIIQDFVCFLLRKALWSRVGQRNEKSRIKRGWYRSMARIPKKWIYGLRNRLIDRLRGRTHNRVRCLFFVAPGKHWNKRGNPLAERYGFRREWITERRRMEFEGVMLWGSREYEACLTYLYGDYRTLPPVEKRTGHAPVSKLNL